VEVILDRGFGDLQAARDAPVGEPAQQQLRTSARVGEADAAIVLFAEGPRWGDP